MDMGCFYTLAIVDSAAMNMGMQIFLWDIEFNYFGYILYNSINELLDQMVILCIYFIFFLFLLFRTVPVAYGSSQARDQIRATSDSLHHRHSKAGSKPHL